MIREALSYVNGSYPVPSPAAAQHPLTQQAMQPQVPVQQHMSHVPVQQQAVYSDPAEQLMHTQQQQQQPMMMMSSAQPPQPPPVIVAAQPSHSDDDIQLAIVVASVFIMAYTLPLNNLISRFLPGICIDSIPSADVVMRAMVAAASVFVARKLMAMFM